MFNGDVPERVAYLEGRVNELSDMVNKLVVKKITSNNTPQAEICASDPCCYCIKFDECKQTYYFPGCFVGRKLSAVR